MKTTATNRKIRVLMTALKQGKLIPRPEFQRRLVWATKHKNAFVQTVLQEFPFPEIYIAAGDVDTETGEGTEMLVDGQQRISTLYQYFIGSKEFSLEDTITPYALLSQDAKSAFLEYEVVVRDLGKVDMPTIKQVFQRINSTRYALNAMEVHNARFDGAFKAFGDWLAQASFFEEHGIFTDNEVRRMQDVRFALTLVITLLSTYFNRDDELEKYLEMYNDAFPQNAEFEKVFTELFAFVEACSFPADSRAYKKTDLFTLLVELYRARSSKLELSPNAVGHVLEGFYEKVSSRKASNVTDDPTVEQYQLAALQASNDRVNRVKRGEIIHNLLKSAATQRQLF